MDKKHFDFDTVLEKQNKLSNELSRLRKKREALDISIRTLEQQEQEYKNALAVEKERKIKQFIIKISNKDNDEEAYLSEKLENTTSHLKKNLQELQDLDRKIYLLSDELSSIHMERIADEAKRDNLATTILSDQEHPLAIEYKERSKEYESLKREAKEIESSISLGRAALKTIGQMGKSLDSARRWASYDVWSDGGLITDVMKYKNVQEGDRLSSTLMREVSRYNKSLSKLESIQHELNYTKISTTQKVIDIGFDNLFTNLSVRSKIRNNEYEVQELEKKISRKQDQLRTLLAANKKESRSLERQLELINRKYQDSLVSEE